MNNILISDDTENGVFALQSDTVYTIMSGVSVSSTTGYSLDAGTGATNRELVVNGHITGTSGVLVGDAASGKGGGKLSISVAGDIKVTDDAIHIAGDDQVVNNNGFVQGDVGLHSLGAHTTVVNHGWILGATTALELQDGAGATGTIRNSGIISGYDAVRLVGSDDAKYSVTNTGTINGTGERAIEGSEGADKIRNSGEISGFVDLGFGNDTFDNRDGVVNGSVNGGNGNDLYIVDNSVLVIQEDKFSGTDLVKSTVSYTLAANFEKLTLIGTDATSGTGNGSANTITGNIAKNVLSGGAGKDHLNGGRGNDVLTGGQDADTFIFTKHSGHDTVTDFHATGSGHDRIDIAHMAGIDNLGDLKDHAEQHGKNVVIDFGHGDVLTLKHVDLHDLSASDFLF